MEVLNGVRKQVNCFDQGFKCFCEIFSLRLSTIYFQQI